VDKLMPTADVLFGIMGEYWWDRWDASPFAHWKRKMVRLDMAVDVMRYPRVKRRFNPPGKRGFLYIGENDPRKGTGFLSELMTRADGRCGWIGAGKEIPHVPRLSGARPLDPVFMSRVTEDFDFFVSPSRADPNPTTILESMAWGFPVVSTPESGYYATNYRSHIFRDDLEASLSVLAELQWASEEDLINRANVARRVVEESYTWERFTNTVTQHLGL